MEGNEKLQNYIPLSRKFFKNDLWLEKREFSRAEAWLWILQEARYSPDEGYYQIGKRKIIWELGQVPASVRYLQKKWGWGSHTRVVNFLDKLRAEGMITIFKEQGQNVIKLVNHQQYNPHLYKAQPQPIPQPTQPQQSAPASNSNYIVSPRTKVQKTAFELLQHWNKQTNYNLELTKSMVAQITPLLKKHSVNILTSAIDGFINDNWVINNGLITRWDLLFANTNKVQEYYTKATVPQKSNGQANPAQQSPNTSTKGYLTSLEAQIHATKNNKEFTSAWYQRVEINSTEYYKPLFH